MNSLRSGGNRAGRLEALWREKSGKSRVAVGGSAKPLNACGVRPVHLRNDRWKTLVGILFKEGDVADVQAAVLKQGACEITTHFIERMAE